MCGLLMAWHPNGWRPVARSFGRARAANIMRRHIRIGMWGMKPIRRWRRIEDGDYE